MQRDGVAYGEHRQLRKIYNFYARRIHSCVRRAGLHNAAMISISRSFFRYTGMLLLLTAGAFAEEPAAKPAEKEIFDGKTLTGWKATDFAGAGEVAVKDGTIVLNAGDPLTGVNYTVPTPKMNYEITLDAMRVEGSDFFCGLTFPVGDTSVTFVVGGWGGGVVGISSIDHEDASENETTQYKSFTSGKWYKVRVKITPKKLEAWLDKDQVVDLELEGKRLSMRAGEIESSEPFGIATYRTKAALRNLKIRTLDKDGK
jgi:hypothetical protein